MCRGRSEAPLETVSSPLTTQTSRNGGASEGDAPSETLSKEADPAPSDERPRQLVRADIETLGR